MKKLLFAAGQHDADIWIKKCFSSLLPFGATIPTRLRRYSGFAGCPYTASPRQPCIRAGLVTCIIQVRPQTVDFVPLRGGEKVEGSGGKSSKSSKMRRKWTVFGRKGPQRVKNSKNGENGRKMGVFGVFGAVLVRRTGLIYFRKKG